MSKGTPHNRRYRSSVLIPLLFSLPFLLSMFRYVSDGYLVLWRSVMELFVLLLVFGRFLVRRSSITLLVDRLEVVSGFGARKVSVSFKTIGGYRLRGSLFDARLEFLSKTGAVLVAVDITFLWRWRVLRLLTNLRALGIRSI